MQLRSGRMERLYARGPGPWPRRSSPTASTRRTCFGSWLRERGVDARVEFVPFGVDVEAFRPSERPTRRRRRLGRGRSASRLRAAVWRSPAVMPGTSFLVVTTRRARPHRSRGPPANVAVETDLPFEEMRRRLERARVVALPVRENSYSGATTVLLQAMALAKPVVVTPDCGDRDGLRARGRRERAARGSRGRRIASGRRSRTSSATTTQAAALGARARATVESELTWERYVDRLRRSARVRRPLTAITRASCAAPRDARSPRGVRPAAAR